MSTQESKSKFRDESSTQTWKRVYEEDIDKAYEIFLKKIFKSLYDKNHPIKQYIKQKQGSKLPVIRGLHTKIRNKDMHSLFIAYLVTTSSSSKVGLRAAWTIQ